MRRTVWQKVQMFSLVQVGLGETGCENCYDLQQRLKTEDGTISDRTRPGQPGSTTSVMATITLWRHLLPMLCYVGVTGEKPLTGIRPVFVWKIQIVIRASRRNGIAPGAVTKAYLPDALIFTVIRLTVSGSTTPASSAELFFFEFNSILETKWLSQTSRTMLQSALFMTTGVFLWLTSAGLKLAKAASIRMEEIHVGNAASFLSVSKINYTILVQLMDTDTKGNGAQQLLVTAGTRNGDSASTR